MVDVAALAALAAGRAAREKHGQLAAHQLGSQTGKPVVSTVTEKSFKSKSRFEARP